jgi:uncharacterized damage-inducible protein DinB
MDLQTLRRLYEFNAWADRRTLESCAVLTPEQFTQDLKSSFHSVRDTLVHIFGAEWVWCERWQGRSPTGLPWTANFTDYDSVSARWNEVLRDLQQFVEGLTQADLNRPLEVRTFAGGIYKQPLWEMMQHVVNHGSYHRGQIATMLRQLGAQPPTEDLILFYRESNAAASAT